LVIVIEVVLVVCLEVDISVIDVIVILFIGLLLQIKWEVFLLRLRLDDQTSFAWHVQEGLV